METQTKLTYYLFGGIILGSIFHNTLSVLLGFEEPVFFFLSLLSIFGFFASIVYNILTYAQKGEPKDLWRLGFLGLFGIVGILLRVEFFVFYAFFAFFGLKRSK